MSISWIRCLPIRNKNNLDLMSIKSEDIKQVIHDSVFSKYENREVTEGTLMKDSFNKNVSQEYGGLYTLSKANTISDMNISNVFENNPELVRASSFMYPEVTMDHLGCVGHECLIDTKDIDQIIISQRVARETKKKFTPPVFLKTGIAICPNPVIEVKEMKYEMSTHKSSVLESDKQYCAPGNMEFIEYTYPTIGHRWRYTTFAIPFNRTDWEWIYNYIRDIKNSFFRKYHCEVFLSNEPGKYKGHIAYLVRLESISQAYILQCRSGLPKCLREILATPTNAIHDIDCFATEYLIKRKYIFKTNRAVPQTEKPVETKTTKPVLLMKSDYSVESFPQETMALLKHSHSESGATSDFMPVKLNTMPQSKKMTLI